MSSHSSTQALQLIRRFQKLADSLDADQLLTRLLRLLQSRSLFERCVLVSVGAEPRVEAAQQRDRAAQLQLGALQGCSELPEGLLQQAISACEPLQLALNGTRPAGVGAGCRSLIIQPLGEPLQALWYCESKLGLDELQTQRAWLQAFWTLSEQVLERPLSDRQGEGRAGLAQLPQSSQTCLDAILANSPALITVRDLQGRLQQASERYTLLAGADRQQLLGTTLADLHGPVTAAELQASDQQVLASGRVLESSAELTHRDGSIHTYWTIKFPLRDEQQNITGVCTIASDISERVEVEKALREQQSRLDFVACHDELTGLPNRSLFYDRIAHSINRCRRSGSQVVLMLLDVDRFKTVNDSLDHEAGDHLLQVIAERLQHNLRDRDTAARLGGDEFVVVLEGVHAEEDISLLAAKILREISGPVAIQGHEIRASVSMGIVVFPQDGDTVDALLRHAEIAMYRAKDNGRNQFKFYTDDMNASAQRSLLLENELRRAIENEQLSLYYQPQFDLVEQRLVGMEVLVRWQHPQRGLISPAHFIPLAEESGLIVPLGDWVLRNACVQMKSWLEQGKYRGKVAINLSARQFGEQNFSQRLAEILEETGLPPCHLELEITESCAMEHAGHTVTMLNDLNAMGVSLAIDDFGTGYSSLAYLKQFPIQKLKIDRSFVKDITTDSNDAAIAQSIISLAHNMSLQVVAEGVEQIEQADWLRLRDCDMVQGFHYARPMSARQLSGRLSGGDYQSSNVVSLEYEVSELATLSPRGKLGS